MKNEEASYRSIQLQTEATLTSVPRGAPSWVIEELIIDTLDTFQPYFAEKLTNEDALEMLLNATNFFELLDEI